MNVSFSRVSGNIILVVEGRDMLLNLKEAAQLRQSLNENHKSLRSNKNWENCQYEHHADDCNRRGMCGDR